MRDVDRAVRVKTIKFLRIIPWFILPLSPLLIILSYPKAGISWLAWLALAPFAYFVLRLKSHKLVVLGGWLCGFISYLGLLYWIYPTMRAGGVSIAVSFLGLFALAALMAIEFAIVAAFGVFIRRLGNGAFPFLFASAWVCVEWLKINICRKAIWFPWFIMGYSQWQMPEFVQIASLIGAQGLSWFICFSGAFSAIVLSKSRPFYKKVLALYPIAILIACLWFFGHNKLLIPNQSVNSVNITVSLLQPCINLYEKWDKNKENSIKDKLFSFVQAAGKKDLVLWPENALPGWIDDPNYSNWLNALAKDYGANHIVGSVSRGDGKRVAACLISPSGENAEYHKRILVPFGEYVPFRNFLGKFISTIAFLGEFEAGGMKQNFMQVKGLKIAPAICYESVFPFLFSSDAERGADLFVNLTNDGWYLNTSAPYQHLAALVFRAAETHRPVLRAANNGISAVINANGQIISSLELNKEGVLEAQIEVPQNNMPSFYVKYGKFFAAACLMLCFAFALAAVIM